MTKKPEQWARNLLEAVHDASDMGSACGMVDCPQCKAAALTIQRAFEERTGQLIPAPSVETVARAIANADLDGPDPEDYWQYLATAAISAMQVKP